MIERTVVTYNRALTRLCLRQSPTHVPCDGYIGRTFVAHAVTSNLDGMVLESHLPGFRMNEPKIRFGCDLECFRGEDDRPLKMAHHAATFYPHRGWLSCRQGVRDDETIRASHGQHPGAGETPGLHLPPPLAVHASHHSSLLDDVR